VTLSSTSSGSDAKNTVKDGAREAADSKWIDRLARLGLAARGLVYVVVGIIALQIAGGSENSQADKQGALQVLAANPVGKAAIVVAIVGFIGYALWRLTETIWGHTEDDGIKRWGKRGFSLFRAVLYTWFAISAIMLLAGSSGSGSDKTSKEWTARFMEQPFGRYLVIAVGVGFVAAALGLVWRGVTTKFDEKLKLGEMSPGMQSAVEKVGLVGNVARGVVFGIVGIFLVVAAVQFDPKKARGLDGSLRTLAGNDWGQVVLWAVAFGLVAYGVFSFAEARYRRT
jgi:hypothetical protein